MTATAQILCACGGDPGDVWRELVEAFPSLSPLCPACEAQAEDDDRRAQRSAHQDAEAKQREERLAVIPPEMLATDPEDPRFNGKLWKAVSDWSPVGRKWLGIMGTPGMCKTRVLALLAKRLILEGRHVVWATACEFQGCVEDLASKRPHINEPARDRLQEIRNAGVLVLDDIGKNTWFPMLERHLFELIDYRKTHYRPVLWSANKTLPEMLKSGLLTEERAGPILGRLAEASRQIVTN